jgi:putative transposase
MIVGLFAQTTKETTMAEGHRMTAAREAVEQLMASEHADVLRESVAFMVRELMEAEVAAQVGAELGERAPDERMAQRNGYRARRWDTRAGEIELAIPKLRQGSYFPSFLEPRKRSEQALVAVVQEAYVNGVSTRKVDRLVEQTGLRGMSKDQVSRLCRGLDEQVRAFRERRGERGGRRPTRRWSGGYARARRSRRVATTAAAAGDRSQRWDGSRCQRWRGVPGPRVPPRLAACQSHQPSCGSPTSS